MSINRVTVIGAGAMGAGIAQVAATSGLDVALRDLSEEALARGMSGIEKSLGRQVKAGTLTERDSGAAIGRIKTTTDLEQACFATELVIEAVFEDLAIKLQLFGDLDRLSPATAILATNTSQLSITAIAGATGRRDRVVGMHWFNPPPVMKLIEIVRGLDTSEATLKAILDVSRRMGKETIVCKDAQGFITSRALSALLMECYRIAEEGIASYEDIDKAIRLGLNHPMGPLELGDYVGLDVLYHASKGMVEAYGDRHRPTQTLAKLVEAGHNGRKSGKGFYEYPAGRPAATT